MSRPTDKPMARAQAHLAAGRYAEAIGAFRAVLGIDPSMIAPRLGMADAMAARGQPGIAATELIDAAERCAAHEQHADALALYGKALALVPARMELHLDVAVVEQAMGRTEAAVARVEGLAERYMSMGRTDEAAELLRFAASWDEIAIVEAEEIIEEIEPEEATVIALNPLLSPRPSRSSRRVEVDEAELTVARAVSAPRVLDDMVTRVASSARKPAASLARPIVASQKPESSSAVARPLAASPRAAVSSAKPSSSEAVLVERLRQRAGMGRDEEVTLRFRHPRGSLRSAVS